jgi:CBS domain-containing protein
MVAAPPIVPSHLAMLAARKVAALKSIGWLLVEAGGRLVGMVDQRMLAASRGDELVSACMTVLHIAVRPTTTLARAYAVLVQHRLPWLPVAAGRFIVGAVSREALEHALAGASEGPVRAARVAA